MNKIDLETVKYINCKNCNKKHNETLSNCCWITCKCGKSICGQCGYSGEDWIYCDNGDDDDQYWCCQECPECNLQGCGMCI